MTLITQITEILFCDICVICGIILAEQVYRACSINLNEKYHHS